MNVRETDDKLHSKLNHIRTISSSSKWYLNLDGKGYDMVVFCLKINCLLEYFVEYIAINSVTFYRLLYYLYFANAFQKQFHDAQNSYSTKWEYFPCYWPFVVTGKFPHKGQ